MNKLLGEVSVDINGKPQKLKMTFEAIVIAEEKSKKTLSELVNLFRAGKAGLGDTVAIIYAGIYGANGNQTPEISYEKLGNQILQEGFIKSYFQPLFTLLASAYTGKPIEAPVKDREDKKEGDEQEKKV